MMWSRWNQPMNFSQKHILVFTFLTCNVVYLCSWTAQIKAFVPRDQVQKGRQCGVREGSGAEEKKFKAYEVKLEGHSLSGFSLPV